jgi:imidazolonepropionase-like amidohydrolase
LIDVHAHIGDGGIARGTEASRARALGQFLRYGVTTIFVPGGGGANDQDFATLRRACASTPAECPGLFGSGSLITAPGSHPVSTIFEMPADTPPSVTEARGVTVLRPGTDIEALIAGKRALGADAIKIVIEDGPPPWFPKPRLSGSEVGALARAAHRNGIPILAHVSNADEVEIALTGGVDAIMHGPVDRLPDSTIARMAKQSQYYVATLSLYDGILTWARKKAESDPFALAGVDPAAVESLKAPPFLAASFETVEQASGYLAIGSENLRRAHAAGVPLALGTDVNNPFVFPGFSAHEELALMVEAGLSPTEALRAATIGGAAFLRAGKRIGRIAPGFEADLLIVDGNPLADIRNSRGIVHVLNDGREIAYPVKVK